ncbi:Bifunctional inhibitor/lipid-transfer protein/seed storage 2S albumin superfamily protein [Hirschfeldia incana]|nr:Bifunctional inhibitor/lipid-transfer protein/seed storage 2S albumin superfamily protein [Hirschfeldia incana]
MASKNITIALFLTINLVFFGFTMAQTPGPQALICPRSSNQVQSCVNRLTSIVGLNVLPLTQCCSLVSGLAPPVAAICICNALKLSVLGLVDITVNLGLVRQVLESCGVPPPAGFICA